MTLAGYKVVFVVVGLIGVLLIATPALQNAIHLPGGEKYSELYLLGPNQMAQNYPFDIAVGQKYSVYVGVGNNLGSSAYYALYVKLANETDQMPSDSLGTASSLQPLYEYIFSIQDGTTWENLLTFSISDCSISGNNSQIDTLKINGLELDVNKPSLWDSNSTTFPYVLLVELWQYNTQTSSFSFDNRFVTLNLNLTAT